MKVIPLKKQSKKQQKAYHKRHRADWNGVSPVTRVVKSPKLYDRKRRKQADRREERQHEL